MVSLNPYSSTYTLSLTLLRAFSSSIVLLSPHSHSHSFLAHSHSYAQEWSTPNANILSLTFACPLTPSAWHWTHYVETNRLVFSLHFITVINWRGLLKFLHDGRDTSSSRDGAGGGGLVTSSCDYVGNGSERQSQGRDNLESRATNANSEPHNNSEPIEETKYRHFEIRCGQENHNKTLVQTLTTTEKIIV